jgi:Bacterial extracellular solute-binding proteins, family 3
MKDWSIDRWLGIAGIVLTILGFLLVKETRDEFAQGFQVYGPKMALWLLLCIILLALWRTRGLRQAESQLGQLTAQKASLEQEKADLQQKLNETQSELKKVTDRHNAFISYPKEPRGRWDSLEEIKYGHVDYYPFLTYEKGSDRPAGIGLDLLKELFKYLVPGENGHNIDDILQPDGMKRDWVSVLEGLKSQQYDVIATPLFATFDRSRQVGFTTPLFFSNIGLYARKEIAEMWLGKGTSVPLNSLVGRIQQDVKFKDVKFISVKGEISQKLAEEYSGEDRIEEHSGTILSGMFRQIATSTTPYAFFCESFYANFQSEVESQKVVNVLALHELLYPVCFAVRIGDYELKNLLDIRLLQLMRDDGIIKLMETKLTGGTTGSLSREKIKEHFIAQWPSTADLKTATSHV